MFSLKSEQKFLETKMEILNAANERLCRALENEISVPWLQTFRNIAKDERNNIRNHTTNWKQMLLDLQAVYNQDSKSQKSKLHHAQDKNIQTDPPLPLCTLGYWTWWRTTLNSAAEIIQGRKVATRRWQELLTVLIQLTPSVKNQASLWRS